MKDSAKWNDNGKEREATVAANSTIRFLSDIVHGLNCGQNYDKIELNFNNAFDTFKRLLHHLEIESQYELKKVPASDPSTQEELWRELFEKVEAASHSPSSTIDMIKQHFEIKRKNLKS